MNVLITNDDGINAPGLYALYHKMIDIADVYVVAPDRERSAVAHAITLTNPLRVKEFHKNEHFFGHAVNGTPADCVKIAYWALGIKPDLIISGINLGANTGVNILYSGTVSGATEGIFVNVPSFAISLATFHKPDFRFAAKFAQRLSKLILKYGLPKGTVLNVNIPPVSEEEIKGIKITRQGQAIYQENYEKRIDPYNRNYYWLTGEKIGLEEDEDYDDRAILNNKISITPIQFDLTNYNFLDELKQWNFNHHE